MRFTKKNFEGLQAKFHELESRPTPGAAPYQVAAETLSQELNAANERVRELEANQEGIINECSVKRARISSLESELATLRKPVPATDDKIYEAFQTERAVGFHMGLRAVYDLGLAHGRGQQTEPPADLVDAVAEKMRARAYYVGEGDAEAIASAALAVVQPTIDRLTVERDEWQCVAESNRNRIAELTKERDNASDAATRYLGEANDCRDRIAELTRPRETEWSEEEVSRIHKEARTWAIQEEKRTFASKRFFADLVIEGALRVAALPNSQPGELTDEECQRLWHVLVDAGHAGKGIRDQVRALLAAAGRYVAPKTEAMKACELHQETTGYVQHSDRLPYVGLTKEEVSRLYTVVDDDYSYDLASIWECIRIIAKALGAGGEK